MKSAEEFYQLYYKNIKKIYNTRLYSGQLTCRINFGYGFDEEDLIMGPFKMPYDRATITFSHDGRLFQVEYARETVKRGFLVKQSH